MNDDILGHTGYDFSQYIVIIIYPNILGYFIIMILGLYIVSYDMPGYDILPGWWFGTFYFFFPYIGNNYPNWLSYFSEG